MSLEVYQHIWYCVIGLSVVMYAILDGFDLGVGCLHLLARGDQQRRMMLNAIGPLWDGNEVWLVIVFGALFVGFSPVYATVCSAFYFVIMILITGLIIRAVSMEFRSKGASKIWRGCWDVLFSVGSLIIAFFTSLLMGNLIAGIPIDGNYIFQGQFSGFFTGYTCLVGVFGVLVFMVHGAMYMLMKTDGDMHVRVRSWLKPLLFAFLICDLLTLSYTIYGCSHMIMGIRTYPLLQVLPVLSALTIGFMIVCVYRKKDVAAFFSSALSITILFMLFGVGTYPVMIRSSISSIYSLTLFNSSATIKTLQVVVTMAAIGIPMVLGYGYWIYRVFRGKIVIDDMSY